LTELRELKQKSAFLAVALTIVAPAFADTVTTGPKHPTPTSVVKQVVPPPKQVVKRPPPPCTNRP
jgi:hypothetical protein